MKSVTLFSIKGARMLATASGLLRNMSQSSFSRSRILPHMLDDGACRLFVRHVDVVPAGDFVKEQPETNATVGDALVLGALFLFRRIFVLEGLALLL